MWTKLIRRCKKLFDIDEKSEPFIDREYVEETQRIYKLLLDGNGDFDNSTDKATYDIVNQIFHELEKKKIYETWEK